MIDGGQGRLGKQSTGNEYVRQPGDVIYLFSTCAIITNKGKEEALRLAMEQGEPPPLNK